MGYILSQKKDRMHQAIEAYQSVLRSNPGAQGVYSRLGLVFMHLGRFEDAHRALDEEIRAGTADAETHYFKGQTHALEGKHSEAVESYRKTLASSPEHRMAQYGLAQSLKILGRTEEEKAALERFKEMKKKEDDAAQASRKETGGNDRQKRSLAAETWLDVSEVYLRGASQTKDARERSDLLGRFLQGVETAIRLDPGSPEPRQLLVTHLQKTGELERAVIACEAALRAIPGNGELAQSAYEFAGEILEDEKSRARVDLAYRALSAAVESVPDHADARRELARLILFKLEKPDLVPKAIEHARRAVEVRPDPANYDVLAYAYFRSGRGQEAAAALEEGARKNPEDTTLRDRLQRLRESASGGAQGSAPRQAGGESGPP
jgi:tetratricopeptide (TPR) repeat protein